MCTTYLQDKFLVNVLLGLTWLEVLRLEHAQKELIAEL